MLGGHAVKELPILCDSKVSKPMPKYMVAMAVVFGVVFLSAGVKGFMNGESILKVCYNLALAAICLYGVTIRRRLYLSEEGVVREMVAWGRHVRRILPWDDVKLVSLAFRQSDMMVFFEVDVTGWKVLFSREQESLVREILDDYIPDVKVQRLK